MTVRRFKLPALLLLVFSSCIGADHEILDLLPTFKSGCVIHIVSGPAATNEFIHFNLNLIYLSGIFTPLILAEQYRTLPNDIHLRFAQCVGYIVLSTKEEGADPLVHVIEHSNLAYHGRAFFFGVNAVPVESHLKFIKVFNSRVFYERHPIVILMSRQQDEEWQHHHWHWSVVCYLCDPVLQWHDTNLDPIPTTTEAIRKTYQSLNNYGYGRLGEALGRWDGWYLFINCHDCNNEMRSIPRDIEPLAFQTWREGGLVDILGNMLVHQFNLTFNRVGPVQDFSEEPRAILCLECDHVLDPERYKRTEMVLLIMDEYAHFYCTRKATLQQASLVFFLRPFDKWIWIYVAAIALLLGVGVLIFEASPRQIWYALDVMWSLVGIPLQNHKWPRGIALILFLIFIPSQFYVAYFTSDVLAPLEPRRIRTNKELFDQGFRVVFDRDAYELGTNVSGSSIRFNEHSFFEPQTPAACQNPNWNDWGPCLASWPDVGTRRTQTKFASRSVRQVRSEVKKLSNLFCSTVVEEWDHSVWLTLHFMGHLQSVIKDYVSHLLQAGILPGFWDGLYMAGVAREFPVSDAKFVFQRLSFNTALLSVIQLYGILIAAAVLTLLVEIAHDRVVACCIVSWARWRNIRS